MLGGSSVTMAHACPQVTDGGDGLQTWRVAANILNMQSPTANKGCSSSRGGGGDINSKYKMSFLRNVTKGLGPG
jgi:hypothetical protein